MFQLPFQMGSAWKRRAFSPCAVVAVLLLIEAASAAVSAAVAAGSLTRPNGPLRSEQFLVHDTRRYGRSLAAFADAERSHPNLVQIEPESLLITAERVRDALVRKLRLPVRAGRPIHCSIYAPVRNDENIVVVSTLYSDGWGYTLQVPDDVERTRLVRGFVQVLLLDLANRTAGQKSAEIPAWLVEGITMNLLAEAGPDLVVEAVPANALRRTTRLIQGADRVNSLREFFRASRPMSFSELSQPISILLSQGQVERFQRSSQLFVEELLQTPGSELNLLKMLQALPHCWNWQTAFVQAFAFERLLDVEKWWSVAVTSFLGRDPLLVGSRETWLEKLEQALTASAHVRVSTNAVPVRAEASLSQIILECDYAVQRPVIQQKITQLIALRIAAPGPFIPLIDAYRDCLYTYLRKRDEAVQAAGGKRVITQPEYLIARETVRELHALDEQRAALRNPPSETDGAVADPLAVRP